jgi:signal transduction histidine kinase
VLVIDDEEGMREGCRHVLGEAGIEVEVAGNAALGLEQLKAVSPSVVLLDIRMPGMGGLDAIQRILQHDPKIVIIMITGYATIEYTVEAMRNGAFDFLPKPFAPNELRRVVERGLEKHRLLEEMQALRDEKKRLTEYFTSIISHQLRTPIAAVSQYFLVLLDNLAGDISDEARHILTRANLRLNELMELIEDWLALAKLDQEKIRREDKPIDLGRILREQIEFLSPLAKERGIQITLDCEAAPGFLRGNERSLGEVVSNLLSNAIKYNREGGRIAVSLRVRGREVLVSVADTGIGIPPEEIPFVFNEFYRVKNDDTRHIRGTGLGLSIVKRIVEAHGGSIQVESERGKGATFTILLPAQERPAEQPAQRDATKGATHVRSAEDGFARR